MRTCPVCEEDMENPTGNIHVCPSCDFTATDHTLDRIEQVTTHTSPGSRLKAL